MNTLQCGAGLIVAALCCSCASAAPPATPPATPPAPSPVTEPVTAPVTAPVIEMSDGLVLSDADIAAVLEIGCHLGLSDVERIVAGQVTIPSGPLGVRLLQTESIEPTRLRRRVLIITRVSDAIVVPGVDATVEVGGWESCRNNLREFELRRLTVDDQTLDIRITDDVAYDVAGRLVSAIVHGEVPLMEDLSDGDRISSVGRVSWFGIPAGHDEPGQHDVYQVTTSRSQGGAGRLYILCLEASGLVLLETRLWIV